MSQTAHHHSPSSPSAAAAAAHAAALRLSSPTTATTTTIDLDALPDGLPAGACNCTDCGGTDNKGNCFWDAHRALQPPSSRTSFSHGHSPAAGQAASLQQTMSGPEDEGDEAAHVRSRTGSGTAILRHIQTRFAKPKRAGAAGVASIATGSATAAAPLEVKSGDSPPHAAAAAAAAGLPPADADHQHKHKQFRKRRSSSGNTASSPIPQTGSEPLHEPEALSSLAPLPLPLSDEPVAAELHRAAVSRANQLLAYLQRPPPPLVAHHAGASAAAPDLAKLDAQYRREYNHQLQLLAQQKVQVEADKNALLAERAALINDINGLKSKVAAVTAANEQLVQENRQYDMALRQAHTNLLNMQTHLSHSQQRLHQTEFAAAQQMMMAAAARVSAVQQPAAAYPYSPYGMHRATSASSLPGRSRRLSNGSELSFNDMESVASTEASAAMMTPVLQPGMPSVALVPVQVPGMQAGVHTYQAMAMVSGTMPLGAVPLAMRGSNGSLHGLGTSNSSSNLNAALKSPTAAAGGAAPGTTTNSNNAATSPPASATPTADSLVVKELRAIGQALKRGLQMLPTAKLRCTVSLNQVWDGRGSPYMFHLNRVAHKMMPLLVQSLVQRVGVGNMVLVGGAGWNAYLSTPLNTDDLDFAVRAAVAEALRDHVNSTVRELLRDADVCKALDCVQRLQHQHAPTNDAEVETLMPIVRAAESATVDLETWHNQALRLVETPTGYKIQLFHRSLIDLSRLMVDDEKALDDAAPPLPLRCKLSTILGSRLVYAYESPTNPEVLVAPLSVLLRHLQRNFNDLRAWRLPKDVARLRSMTQATVMSLLDDGSLLSQHQAEWDSLLALQDPSWFAVIIQLRRLIAMARDGGLPVNNSSSSSNPGTAPSSPTKVSGGHGRHGAIPAAPASVATTATTTATTAVTSSATEDDTSSVQSDGRALTPVK